MRAVFGSLSRKSLSVVLSGVLAISLMGTAPGAAYADAGTDQAAPAQQDVSAKPAAGISYAVRSLNKTYGDRAFTNKLTVSKGVAKRITYTSSNKAVATVNAKGKVTIKGSGVAAITAKARAAKGSGIYKAKYTITVNPKSTTVRKMRGSVDGFSINWKAVSKKAATGYQVRYASTADMADAAIVSVKGAGKTFALISGLPKGATYYAQVRVYAKVKGKTYYSPWSGAKSVVTGVNSGDEELDAIVEAMLATKSIASKKTPEAKLRAVFDRVTKYKYKRDNATPTGDWSVPYAKEMYRNGKGNCYRYAALFCWLARGLGYDAQPVMGGVRLKGNQLAPHGWVEIKLDGKTYLCDTELTRELGVYDLYMITYSKAPVRYKKASN